MLNNEEAPQECRLSSSHIADMVSAAQGTPLKFEFTLSGSPIPLTLLETTIPYPASPPAPEVPDVNPGISPVAAALPSGDDVRAVGYDGYLDSCQVTW